MHGVTPSQMLFKILQHWVYKDIELSQIISESILLRTVENKMDTCSHSIKHNREISKMTFGNRGIELSQMVSESVVMRTLEHF